MTLKPPNVSELQASLRAAFQRGERVDAVELAAFNRVLAHVPEDMTVTVEAGVTLAALQKHVARAGQWLPIDPPHAERLTVAELLMQNPSGPRRCGYGTIREHLLGLNVVLADGRLVHSGGRVVKNVAGYDLCKLFVGSRGTLGVAVEATFKLRPLPEVERFVQLRCVTLDEAGRAIERVLDSDLTPVVFDLHRLATSNSQISTVLGFAGTPSEVDWLLARAAGLGFSESATLDYEADFWRGGAGDVHSQSVLPSKLIETVQTLGAVPFVARVANGSIVYRGGPSPTKASVPTDLIRRIKTAYDPKGIFLEPKL